LLSKRIQVNEINIIEINQLSQKIQQEIDEYEKKCIESFEKNTDKREELQQKNNSGKNYSEKFIECQLDDHDHDERVVLSLSISV
jgi:DNA repair exonuclease SbcCD ATPase subunit